MTVQLSILVANNDSLIGLGYTRIEVWQSIDGGDTYQEVTAASAQAAFQDSFAAQTTFRQGGKLLKFIINGGSEVSVSFSPLVDYWTAQQVADRINEVAPGVASVVSDKVRLSSSSTGRASSVEVTYSDGADLGFPIVKVFGKDPRITLTPSTLSYLYSDVSGLTSARYRWRFSANGVDPLSEYSSYVFGSEVPLVGSGQISVCSTTFIGLNGQPVKTKVIVVADQPPSALGGYAVTNHQPLIFESGADGFIQFTLVRGAKVRVAIEGSSFVREFIVPNAASFDLLSVLSVASDPFTVQSVPPYLIRRNV